LKPVTTVSCAASYLPLPVELLAEQGGQVLGGVPVPVRSAVRHHELPALTMPIAGAVSDGHAALVDRGVMPLAESKIKLVMAESLRRL
jgi:hypothetical protein